MLLGGIPALEAGGCGSNRGEELIVTHGFWKAEIVGATPTTPTNFQNINKFDLNHTLLEYAI